MHINNIENIFDNYSWVFVVAIVIFIIVFVVAAISVIVGIIKRNRRNNGNVAKNASAYPYSQKKKRTDIDPFGLTGPTDSPFAEFEQHEDNKATNAEIAATNDGEQSDVIATPASSCPSCGAPREPGKFCPFCGNRYNDAP